MTYRAIIVLIVLLAVAVSRADATLIQLAGSADVETKDEAASFAVTVDGITSTLTANVGVLNTTLVSGFGINAPGSLDQSSLLR